MEKAIVLVNLSPGTEEATTASLRNGPGISEVYQLYGLYDLLVVVAGPDDQAVKATIAQRLRSNQNIISTITMKVVH